MKLLFEPVENFHNFAPELFSGFSTSHFVRRIIISIFLALFFSTNLVSSALATNNPNGGLIITYNGSPISGPIFLLNDVKPGDCEVRELQIKNTQQFAVPITVKGVKTAGDTENPLLESVLDLVIKNAGGDLYGGTNGAKTVAQFFLDSVPNGVSLGSAPPQSLTTITFTVCFPIESGNEYQKKRVVFDLIFNGGGQTQDKRLVINEVVYTIDPAHGFDSPKDRGILNWDNKKATVSLGDDGNGNVKTAEIDLSKLCKILQQNDFQVESWIEQLGNSGNNSQNNTAGGPLSLVTGWIDQVVNILTFGGVNLANFNCGKKLGLNHEWLEIYNPGTSSVNLKNWKLRDDSGITRTIHANANLGSGKFALVSKDASTWSYWIENSQALKINLGQQIGDGLGNKGDHVFLINPSGQIVDAVAWQMDTQVWDPAVATVSAGISIERLTPGFDNDVMGDWLGHPPTPGD